VTGFGSWRAATGFASGPDIGASLRAAVLAAARGVAPAPRPEYQAANWAAASVVTATCTSPSARVTV
jgi:hypothetical protein